jgi:Ca2+-binding RTX toxin-like protein
MTGSTSLTTVKPSDVAISADGTRLYAAGEDGQVRVYDLATRALLQTWPVGIKLGGIDISPDGSFVLVTEHQWNGAWGPDNVFRSHSIVYKLDLATGAVASFSIEHIGADYTFYDVAILATGEVLLTQDAYSASLPLWKLDLATGQFTASAETYSVRSVLQASADRSHALLAKGNISDAPIFVYEGGTGIVHAHAGYQDNVQGYNLGVFAISEAANLVVQNASGHLYVYDTALDYQFDLSALHPGYYLGTNLGGVAFDATGANLYILSDGIDGIIQIATSDWHVVRTFDVGADVGDSQIGGFGNRLSLSPDGATFIVSTASGIQLVANQPSTSGLPGQGQTIGGPGDDTLQGGYGGETLVGDAGADTISGGGGNDFLYSHLPLPPENLYGYPYQRGSGDIYADRDSLSGGAGSDYFFAGYGDSVDGGPNDSDGDKLWINFQGATSGVVADFRPLGTGATVTIGGATISGIEEVVTIDGSEFDDFLAAWSPSFGYPTPAYIYGRGGNDIMIASYWAGWGDSALFGGEGNDLIDLRGAGYGPEGYGEAGDDRILGASGSDNLYGGEGNDTLEGNNGFDNLYGGAGNDDLQGGDSDDRLEGEEGDDLLTGGAGADSLKGGAGSDTADYSRETGGGGIIVNLSGNPVPVANRPVLQPGQALDSHGTVDTLNSIENIKTGSGADIVYGDAAANRIETGGGGDFITGGAGADTLIGGSGDDQYFIYAADSATFEDSIVELPGGGTDQIRTTLPSFSLAGLPEIENLIGLTNISFTLTGNDRDNYIQGNASADTLIGGLGNDELVGLGGADTMRGGVGDDIYRVEDIGDVVEENAGEGTDLIWTSLATYSLLGTQVENLFALNGIAHSFRGSSAGNVIASGDANDVFLLQDGGDDEAIGGGGNDIFYFGSALGAGDVADGGDGRDAIVLQGNVTVVLSDTNLVGIESISIQSGANATFGDTANNFYDYSVTTADGNVAAGQQLIVNAQSLRAGEDFTFNGSAEHDGKFLVYGGHGVDHLTGGDGVDVFFFEGDRWGAGDKVDGGAGRDAVVISAGDGLTHIEFAADALINIESISVNNHFATDPSQHPSYELVLNNGNVTAGGTLIVNGSSLPGGQVVKIDGSAVHDGNLILFGGGGHDTLTAGSGADLIVGGAGADGLTGGAGADVFRYDSASDSAVGLSDLIGDFAPGLDKIDLSRIDANTGLAGDQAFTWIGESALSNAAGELRTYQSGGYQWVEGDTNGDGHADFAIALTPPPAPLLQGDFIL